MLPMSGVELFNEFSFIANFTCRRQIRMFSCSTFALAKGSVRYLSLQSDRCTLFFALTHSLFLTLYFYIPAILFILFSCLGNKSFIKTPKLRAIFLGSRLAPTRMYLLLSQF